MLIEKIATAYQKAEIGLISGLAGSTNGVINEAMFFDSGYIQTMIERNQREYSNAVDTLKIHFEMKNDTAEWKQRAAELVAQRNEILYRLVFLSSNVQSNLEKCAELCKGEDIDFSRCIDALLACKRGDKATALMLFDDYYNENGKIGNHFLANKIYGTLLTEKGEYDKAAGLLTHALQFVPDDIDTLKCLKLCYERMGSTRRADVINEILSVLYNVYC